jgi:carbon starvation protein
MFSIIIAFGSLFIFLAAYFTYGRFLANRVFSIDDKNITPAVTLRDDWDYVPSNVEVLFGHHFTAIAGTGPIVGPAIAIFWGWLPALLWVVIGSIVIGAVHDFGALVLSLRHAGKSIGDVCASVINPRVRILFLALIAVSLFIVLAVLCLVMAVLFTMYPQSVIPVWVQIPLALMIGQLVYRRGMKPLPLSLIAVAIVYIFVVIGTYVPLAMPQIGALQPLTVWTIILLIYAAVASILPVWRLLQPRDYLNGHQLFIALGLMAFGILVSRPEIVAPAINHNIADAPPLLPFLFITVACGAVSGFHSLVSSGTSAKQLSKEGQAQIIGFGSMLLEGLLAVFVIVAVAGGLGLAAKGTGLTGKEFWLQKYASWHQMDGLGAQVGNFVEGAAQMLLSIGIPLKIGIGMMGVSVACFAGTTLDTATRLQRYVISELSVACGTQAFNNKWSATILAVVSAGMLALVKGGGQGGLLLWPLFGATNQLLAAMALLTITVYLYRQKKPIVYTFIPMIFMILMTGWAMVNNLMQFRAEGVASVHLFIIGIVIVTIEVWIIIETLLISKTFRKTGN